MLPPVWVFARNNDIALTGFLFQSLFWTRAINNSTVLYLDMHFESVGESLSASRGKIKNKKAGTILSENYKQCV